MAFQDLNFENIFRPFTTTSGITTRPALWIRSSVIFFLNTKADGAIGHMTKGGAGGDGKGKNSDAQNAYNRTGMHGPNGRTIGSFSNPETGWPCNAPPWGELAAVNYSTGEIAWRIPFGRVDELEAKGIMNTGSFNKGGSVATVGGVLFIGATYD